MPPSVLEQSDVQMAGDRPSRLQKGSSVRPGVPQGQGPQKTGKENEDGVKSTQSGARIASRQAEPKAAQDIKKVSENPSAAGQSVPSKVPQATAEQMRMAQLFQNSSGKDLALQDKANQVMELTGCSSDDAIIALHDTGNDAEAAVNLLLEGGGTKSEWEVTGKKGKKVPKAKKDQQEAEDKANMPFGMGRGRGRQQQRSTSSRGGKVPVQSLQRSAFIPQTQDVQPNTSNGAPSRTQQAPNRDRPPSPVNKSTSDSRSKSTGDAVKVRGGTESHPWEDTDDDWKEEIRETKVFTRSSAPSGPSQSLGASNSTAQQPSTAAGSGPTFSAMVQKQAAWTGSSAQHIAGTAQRSVPDTSGWRQGPPPGSTGPPKNTSVPSGAISDNIQSTPALSGANLPTDGKNDVAQMSSQLGNVTFNRSAPLESSVNQFPSPSQGHTFSSRSTFANTASDSSVPSAQEFGSSRNEPSQQPRSELHAAAVEPLDSVKSQTFQNAGAFAVPLQSKTFTNSQNDMLTNTYSARNIQSSSAVPGQMPVPQQRSTAAPGSTAFVEGVFSQDARANPSSASSLGLQKQPLSPQAPEKFNTSPSAFAQQSPQRSQGSAQPVSPSTAHMQPAASQTPAYQNTLRPSDQQMPSASPVKPAATTPTGATYGGLSNEPGNRNSFSGFQAAPPNVAPKESSPNLMPQQTSGSIPTTVTVSPQRSTSLSNTTAVYSTSKPIPSTSMSSKAPYANQPNVTQSVLNQQYIQQQAFPQQNAMHMFQPMYSASLDGMNDPRIHNVMQPGMQLDYPYQGHLQGRDTSGLGYSSTTDYKYRNDSVLANQQVQVSQQQQQGLVGPHQMNQYAGTYQVYSPPVAQNFSPYTTQMYSSMQSNYPKGSGSMANSYPGSAYGDIGGLGDVTKASNAYAGLRGTGNESYVNPGMMGGAADLQGGYYGNKAGNKFDKPSPGFGMSLGAQQPTGYPAQYFPIMPQAGVHQMQQPMQQVSAMNTQNVANNKQNKGPQPAYWGHQGQL